MRGLFPFLFCAVGVLNGLCVDCEGSESKQRIQPAMSFGDRSIDLKSLESLAGCAFRTTATEHFTIVHETRAELVFEMGSVLEAAYRRFHDVFSTAGFQLHGPADPLVWISLPRRNALSEYALQAEGMDLSWLDGYYSMRTNRVVVVQPGASTCEQRLPREQSDMTKLTHELAHQLAFNSGLQKRGVLYPVWVSEGLATNFESGEPADGYGSLSQPLRDSCLAATYAAGEMIPLRRLAVQTRISVDDGARRRQYAQAWAFFRFLFLERPESLRQYLSMVAERPVGSCDSDTLLREFSEAFGTPEAIEPAWRLFVTRQIRVISPAEQAIAASAP